MSTSLPTSLIEPLSCACGFHPAAAQPGGILHQHHQTRSNLIANQPNGALDNKLSSVLPLTPGGITLIKWNEAIHLIVDELAQIWIDTSGLSSTTTLGLAGGVSRQSRNHRLRTGHQRTTAHTARRPCC
jgi:hypothetical protein